MSSFQTLFPEKPKFLIFEKNDEPRDSAPRDQQKLSKR